MNKQNDMTTVNAGHERAESVAIVMTRRQWLRVASGFALGCLVGCGAKKETPAGLPFVVFIIDRTGSTEPYQKAIGDYAKQALDDYVRDGNVKTLIVSLTEKPSVELQRENVGTGDVDDI